MKLVEELAVNERVYDKDHLYLQIARAGLLRFGGLSTSYLMRKLKVSASEAKVIIEATRRATYQ
jgi:hypothetical protein